MQTLFGERLIQHAMDPRASLAIAMPGRESSYAELLGRVQTCAGWMVREGCTRSEVVGITIGDEFTHLVVTLALLHLGIPQVCLATHDPLAMRLHLADRLSVVRTIVTDPRHVLPGREALWLTPEILAAATHDNPRAAVAADPDAPAIYFTSSGTTGQPKVIALSQRAMSRRAERMSQAQALTSVDRTLMLVPVEDYPAKTRRLYSLYLGLTSVLRSPLSSPPLSAQELCASLDVTWLELSVLQASDIVVDCSVHGRLPARTRVFVSGSRVSAKLRHAFETVVGARLFVNYGAREIGRITSTYPDNRDEAPETVGRPVPWIALEIVDREGRRVPAGEPGEVRVRSEGMIRGYYQDPVATSRHFKDGWFYPGDAGALTRGGALCIHGRTDDMMNLHSIKIFPAEIERVLEEHPAVRAAAAFAISSTVHGDIPVAAVELHHPAKVGVDELMAWVRERLGVRAPRKIIVLDALPRNTTGKIMKRELIGLVVPGS